MHKHVTKCFHHDQKKGKLDKRQTIWYNQSYLYVVTSLLHADTLSILAGEVGRLTGTELQMDTKKTGFQLDAVFE